MTTTPLSIGRALRGRHLLFTGASGFLGKVWLSMMLDRFPDDIGRIYVLLRGKKGQDARARFEQMVSESYAFKPLHDRYGERLSQFLSQRVEVVAGDVSLPGLGIDPKIAQRMRRDLDATVHCAGQVDFNPELNEALDTNVDGTIHAAEFAASCRASVFVQVSTCFVAGNREGRIEEAVAPSYAPLREGFDVEEEYRTLKQLVRDIHERTTSEHALAELRAQLVQSVIDKGHDPNNSQLVERILRRESKALLSERLVQAGKERAQHWGWPNVYTFTKSMAESMLLTRFPKLPKVMFRPAITESAVRFPIPGWNEGLNTSGPLIYFMGTWFRHLPAKKDKALDIIPVDMCCAALIAATAALLEGRAQPVYQCASSDANPISIGRCIDLTALAHRRHLRAHGQDAIERVLLSRWDGKPVSEDHFMSVGNLRALAQKVSELTKEPPKALPEFLRKEVRKIGTRSDRIDRRLSVAGRVFDTYKPFIWENRQTFSCDRLMALDVAESDFRFEPKRLDWRRWWIDQHVPGLRRWSFPVIENTRVETMRPRVPVKLFDVPVRERRGLDTEPASTAEVAE